MFEKIHAPFRKVRKKLGLSKLNYFLEELEGDFNLICDLPSFFPQKKLPQNYEFIGPLFYQGSDEEEKEILDFLGNGHLNILVSMGSTGNWKNLNLLLDTVFRDARIVISGNLSKTICGDNILSKAFVNHSQIMDRVDILICHGGNGTVYQALSHSVPLLFFPGNFEQEWNIQRIIGMGLGARLEDGFDALKVRKIIDSITGKGKGDLLCEVQQSIELFANKPVVLTHALGD
jgi:UDP:flavonoid glycosyltransferase YjiC (YdhE family)